MTSSELLGLDDQQSASTFPTSRSLLLPQPLHSNDSDNASLLSSASAAPSIIDPDSPQIEEIVRELVGCLRGSSESAQRIAIFKLYSNIDNPRIASLYVQSGGLDAIHSILLSDNPPNTVAYALSLMSKLVDQGLAWTVPDEAIIDKLIDIFATETQFNLLRASLTALVSMIACYSKDPKYALFHGSAGNMRLLKYIEKYPGFLHSLVGKLSFAENQVVLSAMTLINLAVRDILGQVADDKDLSEDEHKAMETWPRLMRMLQTTGVVHRVFELMLEPAGSRGPDLSQQLMQFQLLMMQVMHRWQKRVIDIEHRHHHREALETLFGIAKKQIAAVQDVETLSDQYIWRKMGVRYVDDPVKDFEQAGWLGVIDLMSTIETDPMLFARILHSQWALPNEERQCPIVQASVMVSQILCDLFGITDYDHNARTQQMAAGGAQANDRLEPLLLRWSSLHSGGLLAFVRIWGDSKSRMPVKLGIAESERVHDFKIVAELVRVMFRFVRRQLDKNPKLDVKSYMSSIPYRALRRIQMEYIESDQTGRFLFDSSELLLLKRQVAVEVFDYVAKQRVDCLTEGSWFAVPEVSESASTITKSMFNGAAAASKSFLNMNTKRGGAETSDGVSVFSKSSNGSSNAGSSSNTITAAESSGKPRRYSYRFIKLSSSRNQLRWGDFDRKPAAGVRQEPGLDELPNELDLSSVSRIVVSDNVKVTSFSLNDLMELPPLQVIEPGTTSRKHSASSNSSSGSNKQDSKPASGSQSTSPPQNRTVSGTTSVQSNLLAALSGGKDKYSFKISLYASDRSAGSKESLLLQITSPSLDIAAEWYDGLNILLRRNGFAKILQPSVQSITWQSASAVGMSPASSTSSSRYSTYQFDGRESTSSSATTASSTPRPATATAARASGGGRSKYYTISGEQITKAAPEAILLAHILSTPISATEETGKCIKTIAQMLVHYRGLSFSSLLTKYSDVDARRKF
ncbi:ELMO/CED-12 family-domain-containing protein [Myxozyma melibiosi]|uniref:ELMO/CED-12 family-domain-containing protein n=1 Tax=Myxozyma melibiosi TaxID=54550 RepID=A0ABR1F175_9ASCO